MTISESIYGIIFEPSATLRVLVQEKPYTRSLLLYTGVMLLGMLFQQAANVAGSEELFNRIPADALWIINAAGVIMSVVILFVSSGLLSLVSEMIYKKLNAGGILVAFCYASLPGVFGPTIQYAASLAGLEWLGILVAVLSVVWVLILQIIGLREALQVSTAQAILILVMPLLFIIGLVVAVSIAAAMIIA